MLICIIFRKRIKRGRSEELLEDTGANGDVIKEDIIKEDNIKETGQHYDTGQVFIKVCCCTIQH